MKNIITGHFNRPIAFNYDLLLPIVGTFQSTFSSVTVDKFLIKAFAPLPISARLCTQDLGPNLFPVYESFMDDVAGRLSAFLKQRGDEDKITSLLDDSPFTHGILRFSAKPQTIEALKNAAEEIFDDIEFSDEMKAKGASWKNIAIERMGLSSPQIVRGTHPSLIQ